MLRSIENKIRLNAALIYIIVAIGCFCIALYFYNSRDTINDQKKSIELYYLKLAQMNELIRLVNEAQTEANQFVKTKKNTHLDAFRDKMDEIELYIESLHTSDEYFEEDLYNEFTTLLKEKEKIISQLKRQFNTRSPIEPIHEKLRAYDQPVNKRDSIVVTTVVQDTTIQVGDKKGFWKRLANVFSGKTRDTVVTVTTSLLDTVKIVQTDSPHIISEMSEYAEQAQKQYSSRMNAIESQVNSLILADQEISSKISNLLMKFYSGTIRSRLDEVTNNEQEVRRNNTLAVWGSIIALILILLFIILIINDVNKGLKARKSLEEANIRTRQIMESRHKLLLSVSHDIKTPLNSILGYLYLRETPEKLTTKDVSSMENSGKHILSLLENLLEYSSLEQGTLLKTESEFNPYEICMETAEMFAPLAQKKELSFLYHFTLGKDLVVYSDALKIKQIMINILSNAVKYTVTGGIRFEVEYKDEKLTCSIIDTGVGIPEDKIDSLFEPFSRVDENNTLAEGSGFGMYVVKGLVDLLEGHIKILSEPGKGTNIEVTIPAKTVFRTTEWSSRKILIIDDEPSFLAMLADMFSRLGHEATTCNTLGVFESEIKDLSRYDVVLTDMEMGTVSGLDILGKIRKKNNTTPVIIMTARHDFDQNKAIESGFNAYLRKPVTVNELVNIFGGKKSEASEFGLLEEMFENDRDAIKDVLLIFLESTEKNILLLKEALETNDFSQAQQLCHKMLPMFQQIGADDPAVILKKMDSLRGKKTEDYPEWKEEIYALIAKTELLINNIQEEYFVS